MRIFEKWVHLITCLFLLRQLLRICEKWVHLIPRPGAGRVGNLNHEGVTCWYFLSFNIQSMNILIIQYSVDAFKNTLHNLILQCTSGGTCSSSDDPIFLFNWFSVVSRILHQLQPIDCDRANSNRSNVWSRMEHLFFYSKYKSFLLLV